MIIVGRQSNVYECCRAWEKYQRDSVLVTEGFHFPPLKISGGGGVPAMKSSAARVKPVKVVTDPDYQDHTKPFSYVQYMTIHE